MHDEKRDLSDTVEKSIGGVQGEPADDLPDQSLVTKTDADSVDATPDSGPIEPAGGVVKEPPHPDEAQRSR